MKLIFFDSNLNEIKSFSLKGVISSFSFRQTIDDFLKVVNEDEKRYLVMDMSDSLPDDPSIAFIFDADEKFVFEFALGCYHFIKIRYCLSDRISDDCL